MPNELPFASASLTRRHLLGWVAATGAAIGGGLPHAAWARQTGFADHVLWYRGPAREWVEALPVGNGRIGAMVFGGVTQERLQLNEDTFWAGGPYNPVNPLARENLDTVRQLLFAGEYAAAEALADETLMARPLIQAPYQCIGDLLIDLHDEGAMPEAYARSLDIDSALARVDYERAGARWRREVVACPESQIIAVRLWTSDPAGITARLSFTSEAPGIAFTASAGRFAMTGRNGDFAGIAGALRFAAEMAVEKQGGTQEAGPEAITVRGAREVVLKIAMATSYRGPEDVSGDPVAATRATLETVAGIGFDAIARRAAAAHQRLFRRVTLDLGRTPSADLPTDQRIRESASRDDPALAALYFQYGRYLLITSSRPGTQPANLQGIWNDSNSPPWGSKYTININTQMNYWPAQPTNLPECAEPLFAMLRELAQSGARTAREMYGARGWVAHHNTDLWRASAPIDGAQWGLWPLGGAWLSLYLWEHYEYAPDRAFLAEVYPILAGAAQFFLDTLQQGPEGYLVTNPSLSPENPHPFGATLMWGPAMDAQILRDLFAATAQACRLLGEDAGFAEALDAAKAALPPMRIGAQGQLQEWPLDWDADAPEPDHRHVSHLYALYPSHQISPHRTPELARAAQRSLELRGDLATGWAIAWRINLWARLRDGNRAHAILKLLLDPSRTYPNMFDAHPPFQIDGNFGGTAGIAEMLVQDEGLADGENASPALHLLPALPDAWPDGRVTGLRVRGGGTVSLEWRGGMLATAELHATQELARRVRYRNAEAEIRLTTGGSLVLRPEDFSQAAG
ncbi:glycoside hydrolase family 95 protein [Alteraurantiacibacter palmitatis]|uniref:Glycoside hydrolase N-terminal domain-containing protein n=2 Tax=Alteraurantiacibacter palmitatis TaxID=2054628 RepID=A0ABV7E4N1_9SPHN